MVPNLQEQNCDKNFSLQIFGLPYLRLPNFRSNEQNKQLPLSDIFMLLFINRCRS